MPTLNEIVNEAFAMHQRGDVAGATSLFESLLTAMPGEPIALEYLGVLAAQTGDHAKAIDLYREGIDHPRCRPSMHEQLGHSLRDSGDLAGAVDSYQRYLGLEQDAGGAVSLADVLWRLNKPDDAVTALENALTWQPEHTKAHCLQAMILDQLARHEDARRLREAALKTSETHSEALLAKSCARFDLGDTDGALEIAGSVVNCLTKDQFTHAVQAFKEKQPDLTEVHGTLPDPSGKPLVLAAGDLSYIQAFAPDLIRSAAHTSPSTDIHIHGILNEPVVTTPLDHDDLPPFTWSWELEPAADRTMYATRRFVRLAEWRQRLDQTIVVIDMDSRINGDVGQALEELGPFDVAMCYRTTEIFLNQRVAAGFLALAPTGPAQDFIDQVAAFILHFESQGTSKWFVDQMALLAARVTVQQKNDNQTRIADIPGRYLDWDHDTPDALIWTAKGIHKAVSSQ